MSLPWNLGTQDGHWVEIKVTDQGLDLSRNKEEVLGPQVRATLVHECRTLRTGIVVWHKEYCFRLYVPLHPRFLCGHCMWSHADKSLCPGGPHWGRKCEACNANRTWEQMCHMARDNVTHSNGDPVARVKSRLEVKEKGETQSLPPPREVGERQLTGTTKRVKSQAHRAMVLLQATLESTEPQGWSQMGGYHILGLYGSRREAPGCRGEPG